MGKVYVYQAQVSSWQRRYLEVLCLDKPSLGPPWWYYYPTNIAAKVCYACFSQLFSTIVQTVLFAKKGTDPGTSTAAAAAAARTSHP